mmetsp:Transcript_26526/g.32094  ORF Transcript_26526/g.32094 Transcript_26526/m.32094 type:complete len:327 (-) Transcript_26526:382-1362(-)|eukprot:CAMPEP_0172480336 /NCGR_PEP_ID=MMETSP1066-20121228/5447_1 /TAXON_ID=671091 /ORGANISM="Coscinodiscus wailesii, Strain CCMP2513" /LENGTH=326 /DNA_ID=CAMNT_0013241553 /DNA_START=149 /DNA_END=1129 /DNA_ORIENTATION=+
MSQDLIHQAFGPGANLYTTVLDVTSDATPAQLRKAYYRRALLFHPDKNVNDDGATLKFQAVSLAYEILSDAERRKEYDETGELYDDDDAIGGGVDAWEQYFRGMFKRVSVEDIDKFEEEYKGSEEERKDVIKYYKSSKGNLDEMLTCVMLSEEKDKKRWVEDFILPAVRRGEVKHYKQTLEKTMEDNDDDTVTEDDDDEEEEEEGTKRKKNDKKKQQKQQKQRKKAAAQAKKEKEAKEAEDLFAKIRGNAMARREKAFGSLMDGIEERYGGGGKSSGKRKRGGGTTKKKKNVADDDPIPDDEFERIQAQLEETRKGKAKTGKRRKT